MRGTTAIVADVSAVASGPECSVRATGLAVGSAHACALLTNGTVRCWGANFAGQVGDGTTTFRSVPAPVDGLTDATAIVAGDRHTCALRRDGTVWCWGANDLGQLGGVVDVKAAYSHSGAHSTRPLAVAGLRNVKTLAAGDAHGLAVTAMGDVYFWGGFDNYTRPPIIRAPTSMPLHGAARVATGGGLACAWAQDGFQCWGTGSGWFGPGADPFALKRLEGGRAWIHVALSADGMCGADAPGSVRCWGWGDSKRRVRIESADVVGLSRRRHSCAVVADGRVACWGGDNTFGEIGDGTERPRDDPAFSVGVSTAVEVAVGTSSTCIRTRDGRIQCWGENGYGQLGDGTTESRPGPGEVRFCAQVAEAIFPDPPPGAPLLAAMQRGACFGGCPVYSVRVYADGTVIYRGDWHVRVRGGRKARLSPRALDSLREAFSYSGFLALPYACGDVHTDDSWVNVFFAEGGKTRLIEHYHGCEGAPASLAKLEDEIDRLTATERWIGRPHDQVHDPVEIGAMERSLRLLLPDAKATLDRQTGVSNYSVR